MSTIIGSDTESRLSPTPLISHPLHVAKEELQDSTGLNQDEVKQVNAVGA